MKSIGGEFELSPNDFLTRECLEELKNNNFLFLSNGRAAIKSILLSCKIEKPFLLPSYLCESILQPFKQLNIPFAFYPINADFSINTEELNRLVSSIEPSGLFIINYFGFTQDTKTIHQLIKLKSRLIIIEDCSHGSLLEFNDPQAGLIGNFVISSLRKYTPVPDGCVVINNTNYYLDNKDDYFIEFTELRLRAKLLKNSYLMHPNEKEEFKYLDLFRQAENLIDANDDVHRIYDLSRYIFKRLEFNNIGQRRRENYMVLSETLNQYRNIFTPLFPDLPDKVSPFMYPVRVNKKIRNEFREALKKRRLFCPILWPINIEINYDVFYTSRSISEEIICFPIDQRYGSKDMTEIDNRIYNVLLENKWK